MRKILSLMLCILLVMTLSIPALADGTDPNTGSTPTETTHTHAYGEGVVTQAATCVAAGVMTSTCSCGATQTTSIPATGVHTPGAWQNVDGSSHKRVCTGCGDAAETAAHSWDAGTVTTAATCSAAGVKTFTCTGCGATRTEAIAVDANVHSFSAWDAGTAGTHSRTCSGCGKVESGSHIWSVSATGPATCLEEGVNAYGCPTCGRIEYEIIPKLTTHTYDDPCDPDCNVCGAVRETEHKFNTIWSRNSREHWHACTLCGEKTDVGSHYPGPAATEEKAQICLTCGLTLTPKLNHSHNYDTTWTSDESGHWYACDGCDEQKSFAEHTYDDGCDPDCNICGYLTDTAHSYDGTWYSDETGHWGLCTICNEEGTPIPHTPGPEATEEEAQVCTVCGFEIAPAKVHEHEPGEEWLTDEESHWKVCECGEKVDESLHTWDEGTENEDTTITYVCTECQAEKTEGEPKVDSGFPWWIVILVVLLLVCAGAAVALVLILREGKTAGKYGK